MVLGTSVSEAPPAAMVTVWLKEWMGAENVQGAKILEDWGSTKMVQLPGLMAGNGVNPATPLLPEFAVKVKAPPGSTAMTLMFVKLTALSRSVRAI